MGSKIRQFCRKAQECEELASAATQARSRAEYAELAVQWLQLAVEAQELVTQLGRAREPRARESAGSVCRCSHVERRRALDQRRCDGHES